MTYTRRAGHCARSVPSWVFIGALSANSSRGPASPCGAALLPTRPASTQQILELRDQGLTWNEVAKQVDMTVSGAWSRYRRARRPDPPRVGRWQQVLADALDQNLAIGVRAAVADHLGRAPTRAELTAARRAADSLAALGRAHVHHVAGADAGGNSGDRSYLVLAKPNVIMNECAVKCALFEWR